MLTGLGKTLAVLVTFVSLAFMGAAIALTSSSPPFFQEAASLDDYGITVNPRTETSPVTYTATRLIDGQALTTADKVPDALKAIYDDKIARARAELDEVGKEREFLEGQQKLLEGTIDPDNAAMFALIGDVAEDGSTAPNSLRGRLAEVRRQRQEIATRIGRLQEEIEADLRLAEARREDVFRLQATLLQADADAERMRQLEKQLGDLIVQIEGDLAKARARQTQLTEQLAGTTVPDVDPLVPASPELLLPE